MHAWFFILCPRNLQGCRADGVRACDEMAVKACLTSVQRNACAWPAPGPRRPATRNAPGMRCNARTRIPVDPTGLNKSAALHGSLPAMGTSLATSVQTLQHMRPSGARPRCTKTRPPPVSRQLYTWRPVPCRERPPQTHDDERTTLEFARSCRHGHFCQSSGRP